MRLRFLFYVIQVYVIKFLYESLCIFKVNIRPT